MKGVILAAGLGSRLSIHNGRRPKVLLPVAGRAIIDHTLETFGHVGVTNLAIVVGYQAEALEWWVGDGSRYGLRVQYVYNPDYQLGNALSLYAAKSFTGNEPFLLSMADHMISPGLLRGLLDDRDLANLIAVDFTISSRNIVEDTKVMVGRDGLITHIGKELYRWNGVDAGAFRLTPAIFEAIDGLLGEEGAEFELSRAITRMIDLGHPLRACDITGCFWQDIDTWEDLDLVRKALVE